MLLALALGAVALPGPEAWAGAISRASILYEGHRLQSALEAYRQAEQIPGAAKLALLRQGRTLLGRGQPEEAARTFRRLIDAGHASRQAMLGLVEALHRTGDPAELEVLRQELEIRPQDGEAWTLLVERAATAGEGPEEIRRRVNGVPRPEGNTAVAQRAEYLAAACLLGPDSTAGSAALRRALAGPDLEVRGLAADLLASVEGGGGPGTGVSMAGVLIGHGLVGPALAAVESVEPDGAMAAEALAISGYGLLQIGRVDEAEQAVRRALELTPDLRLGEFVMGSVLRARGDEEGAVKYLISAARREPPNPAMFAELANSLAALGDVGGAELAIRRAVDANPEDPDLRLAISRFYVDSQYRPSEVLDDAREAVRLSGRSPSALSTLGWALQLSGSPGEALEVLREAVSADPRSTLARYRLGSVHETLGQLDDATEQYLMVIELDGAGDLARRAQAALDEVREQESSVGDDKAPGVS